jgi:pyridoxamine 5'-phosphate oxidase
MTKNELITFANQNPVTWLATSDDNQPRVRGMLLWFADETGFYFHTGSTKDLCTQLEANPKVEAAFHQAESKGGGKMMRITGKAEFVNDQKLETKLYQERPWVIDINRANPATKVKIFRIYTGFGHFWTMAVNCKEKEQPRIEF